nr:hypothetical protein [Tanacetum cinerariifolium]
MLVAMPFHNLEFRDSNDSSFGIYIMSRLPVNSEIIELLTFMPPMGDSLEGMLVIVYWFLYPHSPRCTSTKILEVVVNEVRKWNNTTTSVVRLLPSDIRALSDFYTTPSSNHK